jgi:hypothetical protein
MVLLHIGHLCVAICADGDLCYGIELAAAQVVLVKTAVVAFAAARADWVVSAQVLKTGLAPALTFVL